jgi:hypothetical protein
MPLMRDGQPLVDYIDTASDRRGALLGESLCKSFPVADGDTLPANVVQLMLILAHVETSAGTIEEAVTPSRKRKLRKLRKIAALALGCTAIVVRGRARRSGSG